MGWLDWTNESSNKVSGSLVSGPDLAKEYYVFFIIQCRKVAVESRLRLLELVIWYDVFDRWFGPCNLALWFFFHHFSFYCMVDASFEK